MAAPGLPDLSDVCRPLQLSPGQICIPMPGGVLLCAQTGFESGDTQKILTSLMSQVNTALAPLQPFFNVIDTLKAILDCITSLPKAIATVSPGPILECIPGLVEQVDKLLGLIPPLCVPEMVKNILLAIITFLLMIRGELGALIAFLDRLTTAEARATQLNNANLLNILSCARSNLDTQVANLNQSMEPLDSLLVTVNILMDLAGLGSVAPLGGLGTDLGSGMLTTIDGIVDVLQVVVDTIP